MPKDYPDHHDAELVIRLYDLRREPVMRASRDAIIARFLPRSFDDVRAVLQRDNPLNAAYRQVTTYWEMVYGMARHGVIHADFLLESSAEGLVVFARVEPYLAQLRAEQSPRSLRNAEWAATECELGRAIMVAQRARLAKLLGSA